MALDPVLAKIPGLAGYLAQDQYSRGQEQQEAQTAVWSPAASTRSAARQSEEAVDFRE